MKTIEEIQEQAIKVVKAIQNHLQIDNDYIPDKDIQNEIPCPVCNEGTMTYTISSYNGDRSAQCSKNCFGYYVE